MATSPLPQSIPECAVVLAFDTTEMALEDTLREFIELHQGAVEAGRFFVRDRWHGV